MRECSDRVKRLQQLRAQISKLIAAQRHSESLNELSLNSNAPVKAAKKRDEEWTKTVQMAKEILGE